MLAYNILTVGYSEDISIVQIFGTHSQDNRSARQFLDLLSGANSFYPEGSQFF